MYKIRRGIFETNSSSMDKYDDYDDYKTKGRAKLSMSAVIEFEADNRGLEVLKFLRDAADEKDVLDDVLGESFYSILDDTPIDYSIDDTTMYFTYIVGGDYSDRYDEVEDIDDEHVPAKSEEFPNKEQIKNAIISQIEGLVLLNDKFIEFVTDKEYWTHINELYDNDQLDEFPGLKVINIYGQEDYDILSIDY